MIEVLKSKDEQFYFVIKANNGKIIATSETYKRKRDCLKAANLINELSNKVIDKA